MSKSLGEMQQEVMIVNEDLGWTGPDAPPFSFGDAMALLHSEVSEAFEAFRDWGLADATKENWTTAGVVTELVKPEGVGSEFADVLIRLLHYCDEFGVSLEWEYERKIAYNRTRDFRHGGKAL